MEFDTCELDVFVDNWLKFRYAMDKAQTQEEQDAISIDYNLDLMDHHLIPYLPKLALSIILKILEKDSSDVVLPTLAAGEMEDWLSYHAETLMDDIQKLSIENPIFKKLLGGVWQGDMSDEVYNQLRKITGEENQW